MQVIVDNLVINYQRSGSGKSVILLHGWGDNLHTFVSLNKELTKRFDIVAIDLPGFGGSETPKEIWGLDNYAELLADFIAKLELKDLYAVIGHSNGGALAIRATATKKIYPSKLVLLASSGIRNTKKTKRNLTALVVKGGKIVTLWLPKSTKKALRRSVYGSIGSDLLVMPGLEETFKRIVREDVQIDAEKLKLPVLLIFADRDPSVPLKDGRRYHELISNSKLEVLSSDDHFIHHDRAESVNELIEDFL